MDIRIPHFSTQNSSYLLVSHSNTSNIQSSLEIDISVHITGSNGLILLLYNDIDGASYIGVAVQNGTLLLMYGSVYNGTITSNISYANGNITDDNWHILTVLYNDTTLHLIVDGVPVNSSTATVSGMISSPVFMVGLPAGLNTPLSSTGLTSFTGCIRELQINNESIDLIANALYGQSISECPQSPCSYTQCLNGGTCQDTNGTFTCVCPHGYSGIYCEIFLPLCSPNPCLYQGACHEFSNRTFYCICTLGRQGRLCDEGKFIDTNI